ncbi:MAG: protein kinase [Gemmataceae bacterium]
MAVVDSEANQVGEYLIDRELGRGAFGVVYLARHRARPQTPVALKVVQGRGNLDRMMLEPAVLSRLEHPNIVRLEDYFLRGDDLVLALEYVEGSDLKTLLEEGERFTQADVRDLLIQLGSALAAAHEQNILHRDLKPANILVQRGQDGWRFVLTDFGIGQVREGIQQRRQTGGTYLFMAPEQLRGRPSPQSDLWALGVVAYRMLTGRMPFPGPSLQELTTQILYGGIASPSEVRKEPVDPDLERAVLHLLDKSLQERTGSGAELLRDLGVRESSAAARKSAPRRPPSSTLDEGLARSIARRRSWLAVCLFAYLVPTAIFAGLLLILGGALFYLGQRERRVRRLTTVLLALAAFAVLFAHVQMRYVWARYDVGVVHLGGTAGPVLAGVFSVLNIALPIAAGSMFAGLRRLQREKLLRDLAREEGPGSERYLQALEQALDSRFEDVGFHLKYAEALFARGRVKEAAAECRVLLRQDPYNFNGNLLLANAYFALDLDPECVAQCDGYLGVSGYCFEFSELREQARRRSPA